MRGVKFMIKSDTKRDPKRKEGGSFLYRRKRYKQEGGRREKHI